MRDIREYWGVVSVAAVAFGSSGCAIGATVGTMSAALSPSDPGSICSTCASNGPMTASLNYYEVQVVDHSGIMLAALTSAADTYNERQRAMDAARAQGAKVGDTVTYEVKQNAVLPGIRTEALVRFSSSDVNYLFDGKVAIDERGERVKYESLSYWGFDLKNESAPIFFGDSPLSLQPQLNVRMENFIANRVGTWGAGYDIDDFHADVYIGAGLNYMVLPNLVARLEGDFGVVSPFMVLLGYGTLSHTMQLQAVHQPLDWLFLRAYANWKRQSLIYRGVNGFSAGIGVGLGL